MGLVIELTPEIEARVRAAAERVGEDAQTFAISVLADATDSIDMEDPELIRDIQTALTGMAEAEKRGDYGIPAEQVFADARAELARRRGPTHHENAGSAS